MAEHQDRPPLHEGTGKGTESTSTSTAMPPPDATSASASAGTGASAGGGSLGRRLLGMRSGVAAARRRAIALLATLISLATMLLVAVLAVHIVFVAFEANTSNEIVKTVGDWADDLAWQFRDIFQPENPKVSVAVNYGLAAIVYLIAGRIVVGLVRRLG